MEKQDRGGEMDECGVIVCARTSFLWAGTTWTDLHIPAIPP